MRATEFVEKIRIIHSVSNLFSSTMNKTKMKKLVDAVFETTGEWVDNFEYIIYERICGDLTGLRQGTADELSMKISFMLDDLNNILYSMGEA